MRRICVFYRQSIGRLGLHHTHVEWIVCKECQQKLKLGRRLLLIEQAARELNGKPKC
jgi:hypothetical protein